MTCPSYPSDCNPRNDSLDLPESNSHLPEALGKALVTTCLVRVLEQASEEQTAIIDELASKDLSDSEFLRSVFMALIATATPEQQGELARLRQLWRSDAE